jgi:hypothetical protein
MKFKEFKIKLAAVKRNRSLFDLIVYSAYGLGYQWHGDKYMGNGRLDFKHYSDNEIEFYSDGTMLQARRSALPKITLDTFFNLRREDVVATELKFDVVFATKYGLAESRHEALLTEDQITRILNIIQEENS